MDELEEHYTLSFWYNESRNYELRDDAKKSAEIANYLTAHFRKKNVNCYNPQDDCLPGANYFDEIKRVVRNSDFLVFLLSPGFVSSGWHTYTQQTAFMELLQQKESNRLIAITILGNDGIPPDLNTNRIIHCDADNFENVVLKLEKLIDNKERCVKKADSVEEVKRGSVQPEDGIETDVIEDDTRPINNFAEKTALHLQVRTENRQGLLLPGRKSTEESEIFDSGFYSGEKNVAEHNEIFIQNATYLNSSGVESESYSTPVQETKGVDDHLVDEEVSPNKDIVPSKRGWFQRGRIVSFLWLVGGILQPLTRTLIPVGERYFNRFFERLMNFWFGAEVR